jgi:hypothetical protein
MKRVMTILLVIAAIMAIDSAVQAGLKTYYIVDYPAYQMDGVTGVTDHVSGTILADPDTGVISSASFTLTGASGSYTIDPAVIDPTVYVHISPTQITIDRNNPDNEYGFGYLRLYSQGSGYPSASLYWYLMGDPWVPGSFNYDLYHGEYKTDKKTLLVNFGSGTIGDSMVIAQVPEPATMLLLGLGGLLLRKRRA